MSLKALFLVDRYELGRRRGWDLPSTETKQRQAAWLWTSQSHGLLKLVNIMWEKQELED